jgi:hypothetical protein
MKIMQIVPLFVLMTVVACARAVTTAGIGTLDSIPKATYTLYTYNTPSTPQLGAVFLKSPDAGVEVVPYSVQIITATGTVDDALAFVERGAGYQRTSYQRVEFRGKTIGYLLVPERHSFARRYIDINLYERGGRIYFAPSEVGDYD